jgi:hypothetical protein
LRCVPQDAPRQEERIPTTPRKIQQDQGRTKHGMQSDSRRSYPDTGREGRKTEGRHGSRQYLPEVHAMELSSTATLHHIGLALLVFSFLFLCLGRLLWAKPTVDGPSPLDAIQSSPPMGRLCNPCHSAGMKHIPATEWRRGLPVCAICARYDDHLQSEEGVIKLSSSATLFYPPNAIQSLPTMGRLCVPCHSAGMKHIPATEWRRGLPVCAICARYDDHLQSQKGVIEPQ